MLGMCKKYGAHQLHLQLLEGFHGVFVVVVCLSQDMGIVAALDHIPVRLHTVTPRPSAPAATLLLAKGMASSATLSLHDLNELASCCATGCLT